MGFLGGLAKATTVQNDATVNQPALQSDQYLNFANAAGANALGGQKQYLQNLGSQQQLAQQYQQVANGQGPNPAQAMLAQATGANVANQNALMAGQRGASANTGLIARQGVMQGANTQQQAVGQGATLQAQQQLGALQGLGGLYGQMGSQINGQQNANSSLLNVAGGLNNTQNAQNIGVQEANAGIQQANANTAQGALSGIASGSGAAATSLIPSGSSESKAYGGQVGSDDGGGIMGTLNYLNTPMDTGAAPSLSAQGSAAPQGMASKMGSLFALNQGGQVPARVSPGEEYLDPRQAKDVARGKLDPKAGKHFGGKAAVKGDSLKNDTIPTKLEEGGVVVPRTKMQGGKDDITRFVAAVLAHKKGRR